MRLMWWEAFYPVVYAGRHRRGEKLLRNDRFPRIPSCGNLRKLHQPLLDHVIIRSTAFEKSYN